jgi:hypothetical protein
MAVEERTDASAGKPTSGLFDGLLLMLATTALESLGQAPGSEGGEPRVDLTQARHMIDLLEILQEKTRGNLTAGEEGLLEHLLFDLRMRYLAKVGPS